VGAGGTVGRRKPAGVSGESRLERAEGRWKKFFLNSIVQALVVVVVFIVVVSLPPCSLWLSPYSGALSRAEWGAGGRYLGGSWLEQEFFLIVLYRQ